MASWETGYKNSRSPGAPSFLSGASEVWLVLSKPGGSRPRPGFRILLVNHIKAGKADRRWDSAGLREPEKASGVSDILQVILCTLKGLTYILQFIWGLFSPGCASWWGLQSCPVLQAGKAEPYMCLLLFCK